MNPRHVLRQAPRGRVLVVDDDDDVRSSVGQALRALGYQVDTAGSGELALEMIVNEPYGAALLDLRLPGMDGVDVMRAAARIRPDMGVVLLTAHATLDSAIAAVKLGAADYLLKPASVPTIAIAVEKAMMGPPSGRDGGRRGARRYVEAGSLTLDRERHVVVVMPEDGGEGRFAVLTGSEVELLACLIENAGVVVSCRDLAARLRYDLRAEEARTLIRPHISRLRRKVEPDPESPALIRTVVGEGYVVVIGHPNKLPELGGNRANGPATHQ